MTSGGKKLDTNHVNALNGQLHKYGIDPFAASTPRHFSTGQELDKPVVHDMINAESIEYAKFLDFVNGRLVHGEKIVLPPLLKRSCVLVLRNKEQHLKQLLCLKKIGKLLG